MIFPEPECIIDRLAHPCGRAAIKNSSDPSVRGASREVAPTFHTSAAPLPLQWGGLPHTLRGLCFRLSLRPLATFAHVLLGYSHDHGCHRENPKPLCFVKGWRPLRFFSCGAYLLNPSHCWGFFIMVLLYQCLGLEATDRIYKSGAEVLCRLPKRKSKKSLTDLCKTTLAVAPGDGQLEV